MFSADKVTVISKSAWNFNPLRQSLIFKLQLKISTQGGHLSFSYCYKSLGEVQWSRYPPVSVSFWVKFRRAVILFCKCKSSVQWRWVAVQSGSVNFQLCVNGNGWCGGHLPPTKVKARSYLNPQPPSTPHHRYWKYTCFGPWIQFQNNVNFHVSPALTSMKHLNKKVVLLEGTNFMLCMTRINNTE